MTRADTCGDGRPGDDDFAGFPERSSVRRLDSTLGDQRFLGCRVEVAHRELETVVQQASHQLGADMSQSDKSDAHGCLRQGFRHDDRHPITRQMNA